LIGAADLTQALDEIWKRVRRLNRYVEEQAPWALAKDPERADELDRALASLAEGLRVVTVLLDPYLPETAAKLLGALGSTDLSLSNARLGAAPVERVRKLDPLFPKM
jgi:methionyl-tRNA synthetase